jgi:hypothetical protein
MACPGEQKLMLLTQCSTSSRAAASVVKSFDDDYDFDWPANQDPSRIF